MRLQELLVVLSIAAAGYLLVPVVGAFIIRRSWRRFRRRMTELRRAPLLSYAALRALREAADLPEGKATILNAATESGGAPGSDYRLFGDFDSIEGDGRLLWIRNRSVTVPVVLENAALYILPVAGSGGVEDAEPRRVEWNQLSTLNQHAAVFVGGPLELVDGRATFRSRNEAPLILIFYDGPAETVLPRAVRAGRKTNEYFNRATPFGIAFGVFAEFLVAQSYLGRPAFAVTATAATTAALLPLLSALPPGLLLVTLYRSRWRRGRSFRAYRDLARMPLDADPGAYERSIAEGNAPPEGFAAFLPPGDAGSRERIWRCFSPRPGGEDDPMLAPCALPGDPEGLARSYNAKARREELEAGLFLVAGLGLNAVACGFLLSLLT